MCRMPSPVINNAGFTSLTWTAPFPTIRASCEFPGSSVVQRRTVNPLVGGSNPSRGATFQNNLNNAAAYGSLDGVNSNRRQTTSRFDDAAQRRRSPFRATPKGRGAQRRVIRPGDPQNQ